MAKSEPMSEDREMVHVRLDAELVKEIDHLAVDWRLYRSEAMERLLHEAVKKHRKQESAGET